MPRCVSLSIMRMKVAALFLLGTLAAGPVRAEGTQRVLPKVDPLPVALDKDFEFRKTKLFLLTATPPKAKRSISSALSSNPNNPTAGIAEASLGFERSYYLHGALTGADQRQRFGNYFDFFWRTKRSADVTVRLEYRQEKLRSFLQAREVSYKNVKGNRKTQFTVIGDDYANDGRVISWRCLLIENGRIVAEERSYLWE